MYYSRRGEMTPEEHEHTKSMSSHEFETWNAKRRDDYNRVQESRRTHGKIAQSLRFGGHPARMAGEAKGQRHEKVAKGGGKASKEEVGKHVKPVFGKTGHASNIAHYQHHGDHQTKKRVDAGIRNSPQTHEYIKFTPRNRGSG